MGASTTAARMSPPHVYLGDDGLTSVQARELAAALIETADELDRWAGDVIEQITGTGSQS